MSSIGTASNAFNSETVPRKALPCPSSFPSSLYVSQSLHPNRTYLCNCGDRVKCATCRRSWTNKRKRSLDTWLLDSVGDDGQLWFVTLTIKTVGEFASETDDLWSMWRTLGKRRSQYRFKGNSSGLAAIRRGFAGLHLFNKDMKPQTHLHAVLATDPLLDLNSITNAWSSLGGGYADVERVRTFEAAVPYVIAGKLPDDVDIRSNLSSMLKGMRVVRRIGR